MECSERCSIVNALEKQLKDKQKEVEFKKQNIRNMDKDIIELENLLLAEIEKHNALRERLKTLQYDILTRCCPACYGVNPEYTDQWHGTLYEEGHTETCWIGNAIKGSE